MPDEKSKVDETQKRHQILQKKYKIVKGVPGIAAELEVFNGAIQLARSPVQNQRVLLLSPWHIRHEHIWKGSEMLHVGVCSEEV